jgi:hypothetical protein
VDGRLTIGTATGLATGGGYVWVTTLSEQLLRIDPRTVKEAGAQQFSYQILAPVYASGSLWLVGGDEAIHPIDPTSLSVGNAVKLAGGPQGYPVVLAAGEGAVWAVGFDGNLARLGPDGRVTAPLHVGRHVSAVAAGGGAIWAAVSATG